MQFAGSRNSSPAIPKRPECPEARFLLAKSLQNRATLPRYQLKRAETENARKELKAKVQALLTDAENAVGNPD